MAALQQKPVRGERQRAPVSPGRGKPPAGSCPEIPLWHQNHFKVSHDPNQQPWRLGIQTFPLTVSPSTGSSSSWCLLQCLGQQRCLDKALRMCWLAQRHGPSPWAWPACPSGGSAPTAHRSVMLPTPKTHQGLCTLVGLGVKPQWRFWRGWCKRYLVITGEKRLNPT